MADSAGVRSSARLSGDAAGGSGGGGGGGRSAGARGRPVSSTAAAAQRRARAAERAAEVEDSPRVLRDKCRRLARALRNAKHLVVYTGAGISTAADIPDYRGPRGVWTRLQRGESVARVEVARAQPTYTHMALTALWARGALKFVVSQNCDGLHVRAGLPRRALAELHGDMFAELCAPCRAVYLRAFDTTPRTARHRHGTRRLCHTCGAELRDSIVHFGERGRAAWPLNWAGALRHAARADVVLCLGSSLKVLRRYPRLWRMHAAPHARPALYIVNLQWTPKDAVAALKINARCDAVMAQVARRLRLRVPRYRAERDPLLAHAEPLAGPEAHTSRRPPLPAPLSDPEPDSPEPSDSDEEVPLRRLAERLRAAATDSATDSTPTPEPMLWNHNDSHDADDSKLTPSSPHCSTASDRPPGRSSPDRLHAFQVCLQSGEATILLRGEHAVPRQVRRARTMRPVNGHAPPDQHQPLNGAAHLGSTLRRLLDYDTKPSLPNLEPKPEEDDKKIPKLESVEAKEECGAASSMEERWAAAIIRRAVLVCRASLYPGLHSMVGASAGAAAPAECAWCARHYAAPRCLWYGPPRLTPLHLRAWRRHRARRYLCACCGPDPDQAPPDDGGWYGKGYRKGRRRRR